MATPRSPVNAPDSATAPTPPLRLREHLGQGAVASVHRVLDSHGRAFAGKRLHASHQQDPSAAARFAQEAELLRGLHHQNLVGVHGRVEVEGDDVLVMELVEGATLDQKIAREAPLPAAEVVKLASGIAAGLAHAHEAGIIHRDLKPSNVLLSTEEIPKIADFGMARATSLAGVDVGALTVLGTPDYMAPECLDPLAVDARTDLYALGCMMFEMCSGQPPFAAATPLGVLRAHRDEPIPALPPDTPAPLAAVIRRLLAKSPADRPQAAAAVVRELAADAPSAALARRDGTGAPAVRDRCVSCGAPVVTALGICTDCEGPIAHVEPGDHTVLVTGPGEPGDKFDAALRASLRQWLEANPSLDLMPRARFNTKIPRLPFTLTTEVSKGSAQSLVAALKSLGIEAQLVRGGPMKHPAMRKKTKTLLGRGAAVALGTSGGLWQTGWMMIAFLVGIVIAGGVAFSRIKRSVTERVTGDRRALPPAIADSLQRSRKGLTAIAQRRHRQSLRGVLSRVTTLADLAHGDEETTAELARAADAALVTTQQLDRLDQTLATLDRNSADDDGRAVLHRRDTWAARLLSLTASLDALSTRRALAGARTHLADDERNLDDLRHHVEALEEVQHG